LNEAKGLDPSNETIALMEVDMIAGEGNYDTAMELLDGVASTCDADDGIPHVVRANIIAQRAFMELQTAQMTGNMQLAQNAQTSFGQASAAYDDALKAEPVCVEALTQYAQLKQMLGDPMGAVDLVEKAINYGRSRDEVQELCQLYLMAHAQKVAFQELA
jgi:lipopolysaccharide biosynthesis regulator YciM